MALPDYFKIGQGTAVIWGESGATTGSLGTQTKVLSIDALAAGSAYMGVYADLGALWDEDHILITAIETGTAPTAGGMVDVYLAYSTDGSKWPGGVTGADGAWPADGNEDEWAKQLGLPYSLVATNDGNVLQISNAFIVRPKARYVTVVVDNNMDQAIRNQTTNSDNLSRVLLMPRKYSIED